MTPERVKELCDKTHGFDGLGNEWFNNACAICDGVMGVLIYCDEFVSEEITKEQAETLIAGGVQDCRREASEKFWNDLANYRHAENLIERLYDVMMGQSFEDWHNGRFNDHVKEIGDIVSKEDILADLRKMLKIVPN